MRSLNTTATETNRVINDRQNRLHVVGTYLLRCLDTLGLRLNTNTAMQTAAAFTSRKSCSMPIPSGTGMCGEQIVTHLPWSPGRIKNSPASAA